MQHDNKGIGGRVAMMAARIANGAASGGVGGAAVGAATTFLPELLKGGALLISGVLLIPLLVFIGVPHIIFGYDNAEYDDIINLTDRAAYVDGLYQQLDAYELECIEAIVEQAKNGEDYDDVDIESDVSNTNIYWLIAINSVAYKQDLYVIDEGTIRTLYSTKLKYSATAGSHEEKTIDENGDEVTETISTLKVSIRDLKPEELMDELGFTDEEKEWARFLWQSLENEVPLVGGYTGGYRIPQSALSDDKFAAMINEAEKYLGYPYVWGGSSPQTSFDCSGFVCWVINKSGVGSVGRTTAQGLFNLSTPVSRADARPGDLVFFHSTYITTDTVTHVGIYVGENMMIHAGNPIGYVNFDTAFGSHFYAIGRI